jgi:Domain of unknown function (DUF4340)
MKPKLLVGLAVVAAAAVGGAIYVSNSQRAAAPRAEIGQRLFPELAATAEQIRTIVIARKDGTFRIAREGDQWVVPDKSKYPASVDKVRRLLVSASELRALEAKTSSASSYAALEVENVDAPDAKSAQVTFQDGNGRDLFSVIVGKSYHGRGAGSDGVYVRKAGDAQAWLAQGRLAVDREPIAWLDRMVVDVSRERVKSVTIKPATPPVTVQRSNAADKDFALASLPAGRKAKSSYDIGQVGGAFETLELDDVRPAAELSFSNTSPVTEAVTFDGLRLTASFVEQDGATWARFAASFEAPAEPVKPEGETKLKAAEDVQKEADAINARVGGWAYKLPAYKVETLRRKLDDLLEQKAS